MMDDNLLSQDDIDALMRQMSGDLEQLEEELEDEPKVRLLPKMWMDCASSTLGTLLQKNSDLKMDHLLPASKVNESDLYDTLLARVHFDKDFDGVMTFAISKNLTAMMADLMLMGEGDAPFEEDHKDALCEIINNIMGGLNTRMGEEHHTSLSIGQCEVVLYDGTNSPFKEKGSAFAKSQVIIEGQKEASLIVHLDDHLYKSVRSYFAKTTAPTPAPAPSPTPSEPAAAAPSPAPASAPPMPAPTSAPAVPNSAENNDYPSQPRSLGGSVFASSGNRVLDLLLDIPLTITIELGRTRMSIRKVLEMGPGSIVEMDRIIGEPVDLLVNDKVVAKGEVVVVDENFGIRVVSLVTPEERIKFLK